MKGNFTTALNVFFTFFFPDTKVLQPCLLFCIIKESGEKLKFKLSFNHDKRKCESSVQGNRNKTNITQIFIQLAFLGVYYFGEGKRMKLRK